MEKSKKQELNPAADVTPIKNITRKEALKTAGKYAAFTAAASIILLSPLKAATTSGEVPQAADETRSSGRGRDY